LEVWFLEVVFLRDSFVEDFRPGDDPELRTPPAYSQSREPARSVSKLWWGITIGDAVLFCARDEAISSRNEGAQEENVSPLRKRLVSRYERLTAEMKAHTGHARRGHESRWILTMHIDDVRFIASSRAQKREQPARGGRPAAPGSEPARGSRFWGTSV